MRSCFVTFSDFRWLFCALTCGGRQLIHTVQEVFKNELTYRQAISYQGHVNCGGNKTNQKKKVGGWTNNLAGVNAKHVKQKHIRLWQNIFFHLNRRTGFHPYALKWQRLAVQQGGSVMFSSNINQLPANQVLSHLVQMKSLMNPPKLISIIKNHTWGSVLKNQSYCYYCSHWISAPQSMCSWKEKCMLLTVHDAHTHIHSHTLPYHRLLSVWAPWAEWVTADNIYREKLVGEGRGISPPTLPLLHTVKNKATRQLHQPFRLIFSLKICFFFKLVEQHASRMR